MQWFGTMRGLSLGFSLLCCVTASAQIRTAYRVGAITIDRKEIFETADSTLRFVGSVANSLHVLTKEDLIRNELLFHEGDPYDQKLVDETERHLRSLGVIGDVSLTSDTTDAATVNVHIQTHDKLSLGANTSYKQDGGIRTFNLSLKEDNFLGNAQGLSLGYGYVSDRKNPHGLEVIFTDPHVFSSWWNTRLQYKNSDELAIKTISISRPFYEENATIAGGIYAEFGRSRFRKYLNGMIVNESVSSEQGQQIWGAFSNGAIVHKEIGFALIRRRADAPGEPLRPFDNLDLLNLLFSFMQREFSKRSYVENFGRVEDVPTGYIGTVMVGRNFHFTRKSGVDYFFRLGWLHAFEIGPTYHFGYSSSLYSYTDGRELTETTLRAAILQYVKPFERHAVVARALTAIGNHWSSNSQITLGSQSGLRGYPAYRFSGSRMLLFNFEHRYFPDLEVWIFRVGGAAFFDSGIVWNEDEPASSQHFHSSVGCGLRIENTKQSGSGIVRLDFAYNLDIRAVEVILSSDQLFKAFSDIDFVAPSAIDE